MTDQPGWNPPTVRGTTSEGVGYALRRETLSPGHRYPRCSTFQFGEFAGPVVELVTDAGTRPAMAAESDGYGNISLTDPWTGDRLTVEGDPAGDLWDDMRRAVDVAQAIGFMTDAPSPRGEPPVPPE